MDLRTTATVALVLLGCTPPTRANERVVTVPVASVSGTPLASSEPPPVVPKGPPHAIAWESNEASARKEAERRHVAAVVSFDAAWCMACRELEQQTFSDVAVRTAMARVVAIRVDATDDDDPAVTPLRSKYAVKGLPTIVFLDATGHEAARLTEFAKPAAFLENLERATSR